MAGGSSGRRMKSCFQSAFAAKTPMMQFCGEFVQNRVDARFDADKIRPTQHASPVMFSPVDASDL